MRIHKLPVGSDGTPLSTEEPFLTRDGRYLFFNSGENEGGKDLHYAEAVASEWEYRGPVEADTGTLNTSDGVQGNPTMDSSNNFYFIDSDTDAMVRTGKFNYELGQLTGVRDLNGELERDVHLLGQKVFGNMGVEISADGKTIFFCRAGWRLNGITLGALESSDILIGRVRLGSYEYDENESRRIMAAINSADLEYAPSLSTDELEIFFTRLSLADLRSGKLRSRILRSTRRSRSEPFGQPKEVQVIGHSDFVEAPTLSNDERELYFHRRTDSKMRLFKVSRDR